MINQTTEISEEERKKIFRRIAEIRFEKTVLDYQITQDLCDMRECLKKGDSDALDETREIYLGHAERIEFLLYEEYAIRAILEKE